MLEIKDINKAVKYITNIRDENCIVLDNFKKEIEANTDSKTHYNTLIYDNRIKNCNVILEALGMQIPKKPIMERWNPARCPTCDGSLSDSLGDGYYQHWYGKEICECGQKLNWEEEVTWEEEDETL